MLVLFEGVVVPVYSFMDSNEKMKSFENDYQISLGAARVK